MPSPYVVEESTADDPRDLTLSDESAHAVAPSAPDENVFQVLAAQARTRKSLDLWFVVIAGAADAGLIWWRYPLLSWLAAGCAAMAAYGAWGLIDRAIDRVAAIAPDGPEAETRRLLGPLRGVRGMAALVGTGAAAWTVLSFLRVLLRNWIL